MTEALSPIEQETVVERLRDAISLFDQGISYDICAEDGRVVFTEADFREAASRISKLEAENAGLRPIPSPHEHLYSAVYRAGAPTAADYDDAIADLQNARTALVEGDSMGCRVCEDSGHGANMCHHNPLLLARKWAAASRFWQCWHCGFVATNDQEGQDHFGCHDGEEPKCLKEAEALSTRYRDALKLAEGRLAMLLPATLDGSDHPTATNYVLMKVRQALSQERKA